MRILGIESSCDETAASVINQDFDILSNFVLSQSVHKKYGGVVPELASRNHIKSINFVVEQALIDADAKLQDIDLIAVTARPGLIGALLVGVSYAKSLAYANSIPLIDVDHLEGHIYANILEYKDELRFPYLTLIVSGGHTSLIMVKDRCEYELIGNTIDDAAGEAYDKTAKLLGLPYPGGPAIDRKAADGDPFRFEFPRALRRKDNFDFSFSGLKTSVLTFLKKQTPEFIENEMADILAGFQEAVASILVEKSIKAARKYRLKRISVVGGVAANSYLRQKVTTECEKNNLQVFLPSKKLCTDNGAMIAAAGLERYLEHGTSDFLKLNAGVISSVV